MDESQGNSTKITKNKYFNIETKFEKYLNFNFRSLIVYIFTILFKHGHSIKIYPNCFQHSIKLYFLFSLTNTYNLSQKSQIQASICTAIITIHYYVVFVYLLFPIILDLVLDLSLILYNNQHIPLQSSKLRSILKMRKRNMTHSNYEHCCICLPIDDQVISITNSLFERIKRIIGQVKQESEDIQCSKLEPLDFTRLIKIIFNKRFKNLKATSTCKHNQLKKTFITKLECSSKDIDRASSLLSWKVAKYNFHTDIVVLQSKSFLRHLIQSQKHKTKSLPPEIEKQSVPQILQPIKQQNQQRCPEQIILENSINLTRLSLGDKISECGMNQYAYIWPFSWSAGPILFTQPQCMEKQIQNGNKIVTCTKFQEQ